MITMESAAEDEQNQSYNRSSAKVSWLYQDSCSHQNMYWGEIGRKSFPFWQRSNTSMLEKGSSRFPNMDICRSGTFNASRTLGKIWGQISRRSINCFDLNCERCDGAGPKRLFCPMIWQTIGRVMGDSVLLPQGLGLRMSVPQVHWRDHAWLPVPQIQRTAVGKCDQAKLSAYPKVHASKGVLCLAELELPCSPCRGFSAAAWSSKEYTKRINSGVKLKVDRDFSAPSWIRAKECLDFWPWNHKITSL